MNIKFSSLCSTECIFQDIAAYRMNTDISDIYDYETSARVKHLIFYQLENKRNYYIGNSHICTLEKGDILFLPHGTKYRSFIEHKQLPSDGIGISFNLFNNKNEPIYFDEKITLITKDLYGQFYKRFKKILYSVINPNENILRLKGELYSLLDELFADSRKRNNFDESYDDIIKAIHILENHPEQNISTKDLADMCLMSESSFLRKFKDYSGGIAPLKYRNNIRLILAEELSASHLTTGEIAEKLGFYDAAHLCKIYKQQKGITLKKR